MRTVTLSVAEVLKETDMALLFRLEDDSEEWIPKSVITDADAIAEGDEDIEVSVAEWFAQQEGLI